MSTRWSFWRWALPFLLIFAIVKAATDLPHTIGAAHGHGTHGTFTTVQYIKSRSSGYWTGTFTPANHGPAIQDATTDDISGLQTGSVVPALYNGGNVYAAHASTEWVANLLVLIGAVIVLGGWCWWFLRYLRQRGSVTPPPQARAA
jgi:hypothetical protein